MNGRYLEARRRHAEVTALKENLAKDIKELDKQIQEFNELQTKVRQDPSEFSEGKEPYYPVNNEKNASLFNAYLEL